MRLAVTLNLTKATVAVDPECGAGGASIMVADAVALLDCRIQINQTTLAVIERRVNIMTDETRASFVLNVFFMVFLKCVLLINYTVFAVAIPTKRIIAVSEGVWIEIRGYEFRFQDRWIYRSVRVMTPAAAVGA